MRIYDRRTGLLLLLLAGCGGSEPSAPQRLESSVDGGATAGAARSVEASEEEAAAPASPQTSPGPQRLDSNGAGFQVEWITDPSPPPLNEQFTVRLRLLDPSGEPLDPVLEGLTVDADMPAHGHGMNVAPALSLEDGWLVADPLLFHMPGAWEIYVDRTTGALTERAQVGFEVH